MYVKKNVEISVDGKGIVQAFAYVMLPKYETMPAIPSRYYFDIICEGYADNGIDHAPLFDALHPMYGGKGEVGFSTAIVNQSVAEIPPRSFIV